MNDTVSMKDCFYIQNLEHELCVWFLSIRYICSHSLIVLHYKAYMRCLHIRGMRNNTITSTSTFNNPNSVSCLIFFFSFIFHFCLHLFTNVTRFTHHEHIRNEQSICQIHFQILFSFSQINFMSVINHINRSFYFISFYSSICFFLFAPYTKLINHKRWLLLN